MSLAEELLADLEEHAADDLEAIIEGKSTLADAVDEEMPYAKTVIPMEQDIKNVSIRQLAKLRDSPHLARVC